MATWEYKSYDELCQAKTDEERRELCLALSAFFQSYTVNKKGKEELPHRNYFDTIRSHLKLSIKEKSLGEIHICDSIKMKKCKYISSMDY